MSGDDDLIAHPHSVQDDVLQSGYPVVAIVSCVPREAPTLRTAADPLALSALLTIPSALLFVCLCRWAAR